MRALLLATLLVLIGCTAPLPRQDTPALWWAPYYEPTPRPYLWRLPCTDDPTPGCAVAL